MPMQMQPQNITILNEIRSSFEKSMISTMYMVSDFSKSGLINPDEAGVGEVGEDMSAFFIICGTTVCGTQASHGEEKCL